VSNRRWLLISALTAVALAGGLFLYKWRFADYPGLPEAQEVTHMTAWLFNTDVPKFPVPREHIPKILQSLQPGVEVGRPRNGVMGVGELLLTDRDGQVTRVLLHDFMSGNANYFVIYRGRRVYLRGGSDKAVEEAIRAAYTDSLKTNQAK